MELLSPELVKFSSLKNSPISSNHQNFHQNWWQKKHKIWWNYCHQNWWHFRHSKTHQILQFTKIFAKIGEKFGKNSIENSNHQNFRQNWWKFWRKFNRKWMWSPTSIFLFLDTFRVQKYLETGKQQNPLKKIIIFKRFCRFPVSRHFP